LPLQRGLFEPQSEVSSMRNIALGILLFLFIACFIAIVVEELFLGGRRKRRLMRAARARVESDSDTSI
jgi:hypothetical protein